MGAIPPRDDEDGTDPLGEWVQGIDPILGGLQAFGLPSDFPFDFSGASLRRLEAVVLDRFPDPGSVAELDERDFVEAVAAYLGEALMRAGGGRWEWQAPPGVPVAVPDGALDLPPVPPLELLLASVRARTGQEFVRVHEAWSEAVARRQAADPSWRPTKRPTPGLDRVEPGPSEFLETWLAQRREAFPGWVARYAGGGDWDFSPESVDALEALVRRLVPDVAALGDPANRDFVDGAAWYYGEVLRGAKGGEWRYRPGPPDSPAPNIGRPYVQQPGEHGNANPPILLLEAMLDFGGPGFLRDFYAKFAG